jgi:FkbM family methyltransferase
MTETTLFGALASWLSSRRRRKFLQGKTNWRSVVRFRGCTFFAGGDNKIEASLLRGERSYDRDNFTAVSNFVKPGDVCFDVGANIGVYSVVLARISGDARNVHSFEPVRHIRDKLVANARLNGFDELNVNSFALGAKPGTLEMHQIKEGRFRGGTSTFVDTENIAALGAEEFVTREVEIKTLDRYVAEAGVERLDFVKIDVEGFELEVLEGAGESLSRFKPTMILEYDEQRHGDQAASFRGLLDGHGYETYEFASFRDTLVLLPFEFDRQPKNRNILSWFPGTER